MRGSVPRNPKAPLMLDPCCVRGTSSKWAFGYTENKGHA